MMVNVVCVSARFVVAITWFVFAISERDQVRTREPDVVAAMIAEEASKSDFM